MKRRPRQESKADRQRRIEICRLLGEMTFGTLIRHDQLWQRIMNLPPDHETPSQQAPPDTSK